MNFEDSPAEAAFRDEARAFLDAYAPTGGTGAFGDQESSHEDRMVAARHWQATLYEHGWAAPMWPAEYGGRGAGPAEQVVWNQELSRTGIGESPFMPAIGMAGPTIITHGTDEQKNHHLGPILRGEKIWCQLFSEPGAGSDLASLSTRAVRDGDEWVVSGQKVWSTFADHADWGFLIARTDSSVPKRRGITYFLVDMRAVGVDVRPLRDMSGGNHFNEVFFEEARIPDANRLGEVGDGWNVARTTLMNERMAIGSVSRLFSFDALSEFAKKTRTNFDPLTRDRFARLHSWVKSLDLLNARVMSMIAHGMDPTAEASVMKLAVAEIISMGAELGMSVQDYGALIGTGPWQHQYLFAPGMRLGGGTDEVQKNIVAENVLGMPREAELFRDTAFEELPHS